jgi:hypothetical protein
MHLAGYHATAMAERMLPADGSCVGKAARHPRKAVLGLAVAATVPHAETY